LDFRDWFCLKDRDSFTIDPKINPDDARFYFERPNEEEILKRQVRTAFVSPGVPKMVIYGPFGSGKTQTIYHLEYYLRNQRPPGCRYQPVTVHLDLEMQDKSDCHTWHLQIMEALGKEAVTGWVDALFAQTPNLDSKLREIFKDASMAAAAMNLRVGGNLGLLAWRWLCGHKLNKELETLKVTRSLGEVGAADLVNVLVGIGRVAQECGQVVIFLMDEAEQFRNVRKGNAQESLHTYLRRLAEPANSSVGFIIAGYALALNDMAELIWRDDVRTRVGENNFVFLDHLPNVKDVQEFLRQMLAELVDHTQAQVKISSEGLGVSLETYPFTSDAFDLLCQIAAADPTKALPRNIIKAVNECCISAWDSNQAIVDENVVNEIAPSVFG